MSRARMSVAALGLAAALAVSGRAGAATVDGSIITNLATATFNVFNGVGFTVSYGVSVTVLVQDPCIKLEKFAVPTVQTPAGTVTFTLWVTNCSPSASAFNVTILDKLPAAMTYAAPSFSSSGAWSNDFSADNIAWTVAAEPTNGQGTPLYLRWVLPVLGLGKSSFVSFQAVIL